VPAQATQVVGDAAGCGSAYVRAAEQDAREHLCV
jgi:hypothetical protein